MKKLLFIIPLALISCKKETSVSNLEIQEDSVITEQIIPKPKSLTKSEKDSVINNAPKTKEILRRGVMREIEGNKIFRIADAEQLPFSIGEEFTQDGQQFILKIQNFEKEQISVTVKPQNETQNIRINQIKLPNGDFDGPFSREIKNYEISQKGEIWLIIGKSNMASGEMKGNFTVSVQ